MFDIMVVTLNKESQNKKVYLEDLQKLANYGVEMRLQRVADVANGGKLTAQDKAHLEAAKAFMENEDAVDVARMLKREIAQHKRWIEERDATIRYWKRMYRELAEECKERGMDVE